MAKNSYLAAQAAKRIASFLSSFLSKGVAALSKDAIAMASATDESVMEALEALEAQVRTTSLFCRTEEARIDADGLEVDYRVDQREALHEERVARKAPAATKAAPERRALRV